jgi:hypothetical protein
VCYKSHIFSLILGVSWCPITHTAQLVGYGWTTKRGSIPGRTTLGPTRTPVSWISGSAYPGLKRPGHERDHSPLFSAEVKNEGRTASMSSYAFMACAETTLHLPSLKGMCDVETVNRKLLSTFFQNSFLQIF